MTDPKMDTRNGVAIADCSDLSSLRSKAGFFGRLGAAASISAEARKELRQVEIERVRVQGSIARTALAAAGLQIKSALVASEVPKVGALLITLNGRVDAVRQTFTNGAQAAVASHLRNRTNNVAISKELVQEAVISAEEATVMQNFANAHAADDVEASQRAMNESKQVLDHLRDLALHPLRTAKITD
jgi:microcompartment protein CcmL/EutN